VVRMWTVAVSKKVPAGKLKSVTVSRRSRPSISSQYSSEVSLLEAGASCSPRPIFSSLTSRLSAAERIREASACSVPIVVPFGRVITNEAKEKFLHLMSNELRNPLQSITCTGVQSGPAVRSDSLVERRGFELPVLFAPRIFREGG